MHCGYVVKVEKLIPHPNADNLVLATFFNNTTCVNKKFIKEGDIGIYFPCDLQLSVEYCEINQLDYLDKAKRNVRAIKLRGARSDGLYMPLSSLSYLGKPLDEYKVGDIIGEEVCRKYIPNTQKKKVDEKTKIQKKKKKKATFPTFAQHIDTAQLQYNLDSFAFGDEVEITLKMHGTSQRTGYLPKRKNLFQKIFHLPSKYGYACGTRRTAIEDFETSGYYGSNNFRKQHHDKFVGKLVKGETIYYEVVGYIDESTSIMPTCHNEKLGKDFVKEYGDITTFSYGCKPAESKVYVYRITKTAENGSVIEYTPNMIRERCQDLGVDVVPCLWAGTISSSEQLLELAEKLSEGVDPIGKTHIREGVVVRVVNSHTFKAFKFKSFEFKVLEGIIKDTAKAPDIEESE